MSVITSVPEQNIWDEILKDFSRKRPPYDDDERSVSTVEEDYDATRHNPVFYSKEQLLSSRVLGDANPTEEFDPAKYHPSTVGYSFVEKPPASPPPPPPTPPDKQKCSPTQYLEYYVFPVLLPALEEMLRAAKEEKCFERKRTKFNACDFLTEHLYSGNKSYPERVGTKLEEIPFVQEHWKLHPRPPLPKSLIWSEEEATLIIQSHWRGFKVRVESDIQELRQWQKEWKEENADIKGKVDDFWAKQMPDAGTKAQEDANAEPTAAQLNDRPRSVVILSPQEGL